MCAAANSQQVPHTVRVVVVVIGVRVLPLRCCWQNLELECISEAPLSGLCVQQLTHLSIMKFSGGCGDPGRVNG